MGLFDQPLGEIRAYIEGKYRDGLAREFPFTPMIPYAESTQIILSEDTGLELGKPPTASRSFLLWDSGNGLVDRRITLVGPDFRETASSSLPFAQVVMVEGDFTDEYDCYRELRNATYYISLSGFVSRVNPSSQSIWCRVSKDALAGGFSAQILGSALIQALQGLDFVRGAEVLMVTSSNEDVSELAGSADKVQDIVEALIKMYEEMNFDCEECEFVDVCDEVVELRQIRERLKKEREGKE